MKYLLVLIFAFIAAEVGAQSRTWDTIPVMVDHYNSRYEKFKKEPVVKEKIIFLGNSITEGGNWKKLLGDSSAINRGIGGDVTYGVLNRIQDVIRRQPSKLFILIGINDLYKGVPDEVVMENIFSIVTKVHKGSPKTNIFVQSIMPLNPTFQNFPKGYNKTDHVEIVNEQISKYGERLNYTFVNLTSDFTDKDGRLDARYSTDGLHLNQAGYLNWVKVLKKMKCL